MPRESIANEPLKDTEHYDTWFAKQIGIDLSTKEGREKYLAVEEKMNADNPSLTSNVVEAVKGQENVHAGIEPIDTSTARDSGPRALTSRGGEGAIHYKKGREKIAKAFGIDIEREGWEKLLDEELEKKL